MSDIFDYDLDDEFVEVEEDDEDELEDVPKPVKSKTSVPIPFMIPVGAVIKDGVYKLKPEFTPSREMPLYKYEPHPNYEHIAESKVWWCPPDKVEDVQKLAEPFTSSGFRFCVGRSGKGTWSEPQVIEEKRQERGSGKPFTPNSKGIPALVGHVQVWLEIDDVYKAREILTKRSDIPCAVRADAYKYSTDKDYRDVFDLANKYFITYYCHGKPLDLDDTMLTEEELIKKLYDV